MRCTAIALGYNVTLGVVGGLSPLVATWLVARTDNDYSPAFMIMAAAAISFLAILAFKETFRTPLQSGVGPFRTDKNHLTLRSGPQGRVSKGGPHAHTRGPCFETLAALAPQHEVLTVLIGLKQPRNCLGLPSSSTATK